MLADDHPVVREGVAVIVVAAPDLALVGVASNGYETLSLAAEQQPDVLLLDVNMPGPPTLEVIGALRQRQTHLKVLLFTADCQDEKICELAAAGAVGCLIKTGESETLRQAIAIVAQGGIWFDQRILERLAQDVNKGRATIEGICLTERETAVLRLVGQGLTNRAIAYELGIARRTVEFHVGNILKKLKITSRVEAAVWANHNDFA
jgi:two-component system, NarL family, nitrate/nitrite response regulator NarL